MWCDWKHTLLLTGSTGIKVHVVPQSQEEVIFQSGKKCNITLLCDFCSKTSNWFSKNYKCGTSRASVIILKGVRSPESFWSPGYFRICKDFIQIHLWLGFCCLHQVCVECLAICISRCVLMLERDQHTVTVTHMYTWSLEVRDVNTVTQLMNPDWQMESSHTQAAGFREDQSHIESPVVTSSFALQLELECIGRRIPLCVTHINKGCMRTLTIKSCLPDGGGSYDIVNNAVISTPGPQNYRSQNVSLRQSWEMNYQEAAIYLQVFTTRALLHLLVYALIHMITL